MNQVEPSRREKLMRLHGLARMRFALLLASHQCGDRTSATVHGLAHDIISAALKWEFEHGVGSQAQR